MRVYGRNRTSAHAWLQARTSENPAEGYRGCRLSGSAARITAARITAARITAARTAARSFCERAALSARPVQQL